MFDDRYDTRSEYSLIRHGFFSVISPTYISISVIKSYKEKMTSLLSMYIFVVNMSL